MQAKHAWDLIGCQDWISISRVTSNVLANGSEEVQNATNSIYSMGYSGKTILVFTRFADGVLSLVDAYVKTR